MTTTRTPVIEIDEALSQLLQTRNVPREQWPKAAAEVNHVLLNAHRPLWKDRNKYPDLRYLTAPEFLKIVWKDKIAPDGTIEIRTVYQHDPLLIANVKTYIEKRKSRGLGAGRAEGIRLVARPRRSTKKVTLG